MLTVQPGPQAFREHAVPSGSKTSACPDDDNRMLRFDPKELRHGHIEGRGQQVERGNGGRALPPLNSIDGIYGQPAFLGQGPQGEASFLAQLGQLRSNVGLLLFCHSPLVLSLRVSRSLFL